MTRWSGQCHCGFVRFTIDAEIDHVRICDCSICHMRSALIFRVQEKALRLRTSLDDLQLYSWGSGTAKDYFCPRCGILPFRRPSDPTTAGLARGMAPFNGWAINTRCLIGFDPTKVAHQKVHGALI